MLASSSGPNSSIQVWRKALVLLHVHRTVLNSSKMKLGTCASTTWGTQEGTLRHWHYPFVVHSFTNKHTWSVTPAHTLLTWAILAPGCAQSKAGTAQGCEEMQGAQVLCRTGEMLLSSLLCLHTASATAAGLTQDLLPHRTVGWEEETGRIPLSSLWILAEKWLLNAYSRTTEVQPTYSKQDYDLFLILCINNIFKCS